MSDPTYPYRRLLLRTACLLGLLAAPACAVSSADKEVEKPLESDDEPVHGSPDAGSDQGDQGDQGDGDSGDGDSAGDGDSGDGDSTGGGDGTGDGDSAGDGDGDSTVGGDGDAKPDAGTSVDPAPDASASCDPSACSDGVPCTDDVCGADGQCEHRPNDALCGNGQTCSLSGCSSVAPTCSESPCKLVSPQCGCGDGQGCYPDENDKPVCAEAGSRPEGAACPDSSTCVPGSMCVGPADAPSGTCRHLCAGNSDCTAKDSLCAIEISAKVKVCSTSCNPVAQTGCNTGTHCEIQQPKANGTYVTECVANDSSARGKQGDDCSSVDCAPGLVCLTDVLGDSACYKYCLKDSDCGTFLYCDGALNPPMKVGTTTYKFCQP